MASLNKDNLCEIVSNNIASSETAGIYIEGPESRPLIKE